MRCINTSNYNHLEIGAVSIQEHNLLGPEVHDDGINKFDG